MAAPDALEPADKVPQAAPEHPAPVNVHVTPLFCTSLVTVAVKLPVCPVCTDAVVGFTAMDTAGVVIVIVVTAVLLASATDCAVRVTVAGEGALDGAVYVMPAPDALELADSVPHVAPEHPVPVRAHVTPLFSGSFVTVAETLRVCPICNDALTGLTAIVTGGAAVIVIVTVVVLVLSATACAVAVTVAGAGTAAGAV